MATMTYEQAVKHWGLTQLGIDPKNTKLTVDVEFKMRSGGYCETCWFEFEVIIITARTKKNKLIKQMEIEGDQTTFAAIVSALVSIDI